MYYTMYCHNTWCTTTQFKISVYTVCNTGLVVFNLLDLFYEGLNE